jgi:hypothetical protein
MLDAFGRLRRMPLMPIVVACSRWVTGAPEGKRLTGGTMAASGPDTVAHPSLEVGLLEENC